MCPEVYTTAELIWFIENELFPDPNGWDQSRADKFDEVLKHYIGMQIPTYVLRKMWLQDGGDESDFYRWARNRGKGFIDG